MRLAGLALVTALLVPGAARAEGTDAPDVSDVEDATEALLDCKGLVDKVNTMKVPANHAKARGTAAYNRRTSNGKSRLSLDPEQDVFMGMMEDAAMRLQVCAMNVNKAVPAAEARLAALANPDSVSEADVAAVADTVKEYRDAAAGLAASLASLSSNRQVQSYTFKVVVSSFDLASRAKGAK